VISKCYDAGLLLVGAGPNVLRFVPPLVISEGEIQEAVQRLGQALQAV
jgi:acetylornithine/N-succinyldiaminopimelate aminotransferase